ncbi:hypothetical protein [Angustibacter aerolatus]
MTGTDDAAARAALPGRGSVRSVATPGGPARVRLQRPGAGQPQHGLLALGHGAGAGLDQPDLIAARKSEAKRS